LQNNPLPHFNAAPFEIKKIFEVMREGSTGAKLCLGDDGRRYVVKTLDEISAFELIAEWICSHLARAFGLTTPECRLVDSMSELLKMRGDSTLWGDDDYPGFASHFHASTLPLTMAMARKVDPQLKTDILLFDVWVMNGDRTLSDQGGNVNLLYDPTLDQPIVVFDHNLALDQRENDIHIRQHHVFSGDNAGISLNDIVTQDEYIERMRQAMVHLPQIIAAIPPLWREVANGRLGDGKDVIIDVIQPLLERYQHREFWRWIEL